MPNWLFELVNPWTTPLAVLSGVVAIAWLCRIRGKSLAYTALGAAVGIALWQAWKSGPPNGLLDLQIYTNSARSWLDGRSLYDYRDPTFNLSAAYPPFGPLLFSVLTPFTADGREVVFTGVNLAALFGCAWSVSGLARIDPQRRLTWSVWAFSASLVTIPVWLTLRQGQINVIIWLLVLADLNAMRSSRRWSGLGIGLATSLKLLPGLFVVWLAITQRWRTLIQAIAAFAAATALGWFLAPADSKQYWTELLWQSDRVGSIGDARNNSLLGVISRFFDQGTAQTALWIVSACAILAVTLLRSMRASRANDYLAVAAIVGCATAAVSPISWTHHLGFLLVALAAFVIQAKTTRAKALCVVAWLVLVDPGGHGDDPVYSSVRVLLVVGAICFTPIRYEKSKIGETPSSSVSTFRSPAA